MLNELLKKQKESLSIDVSILQNLENLKENIEKDLEKLEQEIEACELRIEKINKKYDEINSAKKNSPIKSFIRDKFSRSHSDDIASLNKDFERESKLKEELLSKKNIKLEEYRINGEQIESLKEKEKELSLLDDDSYGIKKLIESDPSILENEEVMIDLLLRNIEYICLDRTDSDKVYWVLVNEVSKIYKDKIDELKGERQDLLKKMDGLDESQKEIKNNEIAELSRCIYIYEVFYNALRYIFGELRNPKEQIPGKYKIPHEFLFEAIRKSILEYKQDKASQIYSVDSLSEFNNIAYVCFNYIKEDNKLPLSFGKKIESLYTDKNSDLYIHSIYKVSEDLVKRIFKDGLYLRGEYNKNLNRTTIAQYQTESNFFTFLNAERNADQILLSIPRDEYLVLGNNTDGSDNVYILPKYVVGEIRDTSSGAQFIENNIPVSERTVYEHLYYANKDVNEEAEVKSSMHR